MALLMLLLAGDGRPASAATFTVNSTADPGDGACDATECTLREAIAAANASAGTDTIAFNISGAGPHTIQPTSALPTIADPVIIDGYTQPGASPNTNGPGLGSNAVLKIELDGDRVVGFVRGLKITGGNTTVRGLVVNRFKGSAIFLGGGGGNVIEGNFIGTDITGTMDLGNAGDGVEIFRASNNIIGGTTAAAGNVISGNSRSGVKLDGSFVTGNVVAGNFIGTDVTGTLDLRNGLDGVFIIDAPKNTVGGKTPGAGNVISGNQLSGVFMFGVGATGNVVQGNLIGTDVTGTADLGNTGAGVRTRGGASGNTIGGAASGAGNTIAFNTQEGVLVNSGSGNAILSNSIFSNTGLGIDLGRDGVTSNDTGDGDTGANNLQNFPVLTSAVSGSTTIEGTLNSTPNTEFRLEFFANTACDPSDHGEGETFLGATNVTTDGSGDASFMVTFPATVPIGHFITATATDSGNNTSEFSQCAEVLPRPVMIVTIDIKPGSDPNSINVRSRGVIPVAVLSSPDFDAPTEVDKNSLTFGRTGDEESLAFCPKSAEDVDGDGLLDLVCHFHTQDTGSQCGDTEGVLRGETVDTVPIEGSDSLRIVPCR